MSLLFRSLKNLYDTRPSLEFLSPLDETYILLRNFLSLAVKKDKDFVNSNDYSLKYKKDMVNSLNLFLSLSSGPNPILNKYYYITCDECGSPTIVNSLLDAYDCTHCREPLDLTSTVHDSFTNIHYIFKINTDIRKELNFDLKGPPSFSCELEEEGPNSSLSESPNLSVVLSNENKEFTAIEEEEKEVRRKFLKMAEGI